MGRKKPEDKKPDPPGAGHSLRNDAEEHLAHSPKLSPALLGRNTEELIHELEVHQVELEMQNEALRVTQLALEESRDNYLDLYEFAPVGYLTLTKKAMIAEANLTVAALLGIDRGRLIKERFRRFVAPKDLERWDRHFIAVQGSVDKQTCDLQLLKSDGSWINARVESLLIEREKKDPMIRMALIDITVQKRAEDKLLLISDDIRAANEALITTGDELRLNEGRLTASLEEKEVLLSEIHHRVKNNLTAFISLLSLDGSTEDTPTGRTLKQDLQNRARSMALIHETLYRTHQFSTVDMEFYLTSLVGQVADSYGRGAGIRTEVSAKGVDLDFARASTAGLIINELVTNSFKYAFPQGFDCMAVRGEPCMIRVSFSRDDGNYLLTVADNGRGLPPELDVPAAKSLGLKLVNFLARHQLRAEIEVRTDKGTEFIFHLKNPGDYP